eukprot:gene6734-4828_t
MYYFSRPVERGGVHCCCVDVRILQRVVLLVCVCSANASSLDYYIISTIISAMRLVQWLRFASVGLLLALLSLATPPLHMGISETAVAMAGYVRPKPFSAFVKSAISCMVCKEVITHALIQMDTYITVKKKDYITSEEAEAFLSIICNSHTQEGAWIRRLGMAVVRDEPSNFSSTVHLVAGDLQNYTVCNRTCVTVEDTCQYVVDHLYFLSAEREIEKLSLSGSLVDESVIQSLHAKHCDNFTVCKHLENATYDINFLLNSPDATSRTDIENDPIVFLSPSEYPREFQQHRPLSGPLLPFTQEELDSMRQYVKKNPLVREAKNEVHIGPDGYTYTPAGTVKKDRSSEPANGDGTAMDL